MIQIISAISSIATLILFILYFIGRIWAINKNKKMLYEEFTLDYLSETSGIKKNEYDLGGNDLLTISSAQGLNWIKLYEVEYCDKKNKFKCISKEPVINHKLLSVNEKMYIKTLVPCGIPRYMIKFERTDYIVGRFYIGFNGKYGGLSMVDYKSKPTLKGYLYYICK